MGDESGSFGKIVRIFMTFANNSSVGELGSFCTGETKAAFLVLVVSDIFDRTDHSARPLTAELSGQERLLKTKEMELCGECDWQRDGASCVVPGDRPT